MLMALTFAIQMGSCGSEIGTGSVLVGASLVAKKYKMKFFDLLPMATILYAVCTCFMMLAHKLSTSSAQVKDAAAPEGECYEVCVRVQEGGELVGETLEAAALDRVPGVLSASGEKSHD